MPGIKPDWVIAGGLAGSIAWWSVYPLDVIKSRIQASSRAESEYKGEAFCMLTWWNEPKVDRTCASCRMQAHATTIVGHLP